MKFLNHKILPNHVAVLVPSVKKAAEYLKQFDFKIGKEEEWEGEGTKEIYVELGRVNSLLLMEPIKPGAYQRALEKRGPGLHHLAIDVLNLESFLEAIALSGWLLHPTSLKTMKQTKTAYLARPGFPALIEVQEREKLNNGLLFVNEIVLKMDSIHEKLLEPIGLHNVVKAGLVNECSINGEKIKFSNLWDF